MLPHVGAPICDSVLEESLKGASVRSNADGLEDEMSRPVIITTSMKVGVMGLWPKMKQFSASDQKIADGFEKIFIFL